MTVLTQKGAPKILGLRTNLNKKTGIKLIKAKKKKLIKAPKTEFLSSLKPPQGQETVFLLDCM